MCELTLRVKAHLAYTISHCSRLCKKHIQLESEGFIFCACNTSLHKLDKMK